LINDNDDDDYDDDDDVDDDDDDNVMYLHSKMLVTFLARYFWGNRETMQLLRRGILATP